MTPLPPAIEALIDSVLGAADLEFTDGRHDVEQELRAHFEDGLAAGIEPETLVERFGDPVEAGRKIARTRPRAAARSRGERGRWWMSMGAWTSETRRAVRRLRRAPGFAAIVVLTLALGVGVNTAIFSVLNAVLLQDLPYEEPDRLVRVYERHEEWGDLEYLRAPALAEWRQWEDVFVDVAAAYTYREVGADLTDGEIPERIDVLRVTAGYFETLGRAPLFGRTFEDDESYGIGSSDDNDVPAARVTVLSHGLWTRRFQRDREVLGRSIDLDGESYEVVGVMPPSFRDPIGSQADLWIPQDMRPGGGNHFGNFFLTGIARVRDGMSLDVAQERLDVQSASFTQAEAEMEGSRVVLRPLQADLVGETRRAMLWILAAAATLVLLTACVNVGNLLFARGLSRDRTLALQSALGSGRGRLVAAILLENGILALLGGVSGLLLGWVGLQALLWVAPDALPIVTEVGFGTPVFLFATGVTGLALLVFGLTPALRLSRTAPSDVLRSGDRASTLGRVARRVRDGLVVVQVAAALMLVAGAILLTRSFGSLLEVPLVVESDGVLTFEVHLPTARYETPAGRVGFHRDLHERVAALPGVEAVGAVSWLPVNGAYHSWGIRRVGDESEGASGPGWSGTDVRVIEGDYFGTLGIQILRGTPPDAVDPEGAPVAWINETIAETVFGDTDPLDRQVVIGGTEARVVGIVEDVPVSSRGDVRPKSYLLQAHADDRNWAMIQTVRADTDLAELAATIRTELATLDPNLVLYRVRPFDDVLTIVRAQDRFAAMLMAAFGVLALALSLIGTYGVLAGTVASRTREIGIRMALGADALSVCRMIVRYAARLIVPGIGLGLAGAWVASRWIETLLFGVQPGDPAAYGLAVTIFAMVGLVAAWIPARRATRVDTVEVLTEA